MQNRVRAFFDDSNRMARSSLQFLLSVVAAQFLCGCAAEFHEPHDCPQVPPSIARTAQAIIIGSVENRIYGFAAPPFDFSIYAVHSAKVLKEPSARIPDHVKLITKVYVVEDAGPALTDDGFVVEPDLKIGSTSIIALHANSMETLRYDNSVDYEVAYAGACSD